MAQVYLDAWTHVKSLLEKSKEASDATEALRVLVDNWTNEEFVQFVNDLAELVNKCVWPLSLARRVLTSLAP